MRITSLVTVTAFLLPILVGIVLNQLNPSMETALGVAYFALLGVLLGVLATGIILLLSWRGVLQAPNLWIVGVSFVISLVLFLQANSGVLSVVS